MRKVFSLLMLFGLTTLTVVESNAQIQLSRVKNTPTDSRVIEREPIKKPNDDVISRKGNQGGEVGRAKQQRNSVDKANLYTQGIDDVVNLSTQQKRRIKQKSLIAFQKIEQLRANKKQNSEAFRAQRKRILKALDRDIQAVLNATQKATYKVHKKAKREERAKNNRVDTGHSKQPVKASGRTERVGERSQGKRGGAKRFPKRSDRAEQKQKVESRDQSQIERSGKKSRFPDRQGVEKNKQSRDRSRIERSGKENRFPDRQRVEDKVNQKNGGKRGSGKRIPNQRERVEREKEVERSGHTECEREHRLPKKDVNPAKTRSKDKSEILRKGKEGIQKGSRKGKGGIKQGAQKGKEPNQRSKGLELKTKKY